MLNVVKSGLVSVENVSGKTVNSVERNECILNEFFSQSDWSFQLDLISLNDISALRDHLNSIPESEKSTKDGVFLSEFLQEFSLDEHKLEVA